MNIGVVGSGNIVSTFVDGMKAYKDVKLYAIWGRHEEKIKQYKFDKYYTDVDAFMNDTDIDVVYVALPNSLHFDYAYLALKHNKHVLLEKPFCQNLTQAKKLISYAKKKKLLLYETIMTIHSPNYKKMQKYIDKLGSIKVIDGGFCQFSRKYGKFKDGVILPVFNYKYAGGALMDVGVYNIYYIVGLFGMPKNINYYPNIEKNIDTSGVLILDYGSYKASLTNAKDCHIELGIMIQGSGGYIKLHTTPSRCAKFEINIKGKTTIIEDKDQSEYCAWKPMYDDFMKLYKHKDYETCYKLLDSTIMVQMVLDKARSSANMKF